MAEAKIGKKGKITILTAAFLIIAAVSTVLILMNREKGYRDISVTEIIGTVLVEYNGKEYAAYEGLNLADGYALTTKLESYIRLLLDNDKYVKLEEESRVVFTKMGGNDKNSVMELEYGTLTTEITRPLLEDESHVVNTPNAILAVRGTLYKIVTNYDESGVAYTDVYTYGGSVACQRVMPDGTVVDEEVIVNAGYKTRIRMDEKETVYIEEALDGEGGDNVDPIDPKEIPDDDLVEIYGASMNGHEMFLDSGQLWDEIQERNIDLNEYRSVYDGGRIPIYTGSPGGSGGNDDSQDEEEPEEILTEIILPEELPIEPEELAEAETPVITPEEEVLTEEPDEEINEEETVPEETEEETTVSGNSAADTSAATQVRPAVTPVRTDISEGSTGESSSGGSSSSSSDEAEHSHTPVTVTTTAATCTSSGRSVTKCSECGEVLSETMIPALGHDLKEIITQEATCTGEGLGYRGCSRCDYQAEPLVYEALGHDLKEIITQEATCTGESIGYSGCTRCDYQEGPLVFAPALGHTEKAVAKVEATCGTDGHEAGTRCSVCEEVLSGMATIPATGAHSMIQYYPNPATCTESAFGYDKCEVCGHQGAPLEQPALGHTDVDNDGFCDRCGGTITP